LGDLAGETKRLLDRSRSPEEAGQGSARIIAPHTCIRWVDQTRTMMQ